MHPIIGIPTSIGRGPLVEYGVRSSYCDAVLAAGGAPLLLPPMPEGALRAAFGRLDGLLLPGGGDVAAHRYGGPDSGLLTLVDEERDALEIAVTRWALADELPTLAICRGIQVLNVAAGGTLIQDVPSQVAGALVHRSAPGSPPEHLEHTVALAPGSRLAAVYAPEGEVWVNGTHQAVDAVAPGLRTRPSPRTASSRGSRRRTGGLSSGCNGTRRTWRPRTQPPAGCSPPWCRRPARRDRRHPGDRRL